MHLRYRLATPLVALCLALAFSPALADKTTPTPIDVPGGLNQPTPETGINAPPCPLGQPGAAQAFVWFFPSDDYYYTFFNPADCGCPEGVGGLVAHWNLFWQTPCTVDVQAWIVKAIDTGGGCYVPDAGVDPPDPTAAETICGPSAVETITGAGLVDHAVALPPCACLSNSTPAFVLFKIISNVGCPESGGALTSPAIVVDGSPDPCTSYNGFLGGAPVEMTGGFGFPGNTSMWVEPAVCCGVTGSLPNTWGKVKTLYR